MTTQQTADRIRIRWNGDSSECGNYRIQTARIRDQGTEYRLMVSMAYDGAPPYRETLIYDTRREVKAAAQRDADSRQRKTDS